MACVVPECYHRMGVVSENNPNLSFHRFPADSEIRQEWIQNINRGEDWSPTQYSRICSAHFDESCFRQGYTRKTLHSHAVPTIFVNHPLSCQPKLTNNRKIITVYNIESTASTTSTATNDEQIQSAPAKRSRICQTESVEKSCSIEKHNKMSKLLKKYKTLAAKRGKKLKNLQRKCSRLEKKKEDLETIIEILHEKMESEQVSIPKNNLEVDNEVLLSDFKKTEGASLPKDYPDEIKKIAFTIHMYNNTT